MARAGAGRTNWSIIAAAISACLILSLSLAALPCKSALLEVPVRGWACMQALTGSCFSCKLDKHFELHNSFNYHSLQTLSVYQRVAAFMRTLPNLHMHARQPQTELPEVDTKLAGRDALRERQPRSLTVHGLPNVAKLSGTKSG